MIAVLLFTAMAAGANVETEVEPAIEISTSGTFAKQAADAAKRCGFITIKVQPEREDGHSSVATQLTIERPEVRCMDAWMASYDVPFVTTKSKAD
ncbi:MAG: hypothetical protein V4530_06560 [Pseudomonadota bacterium]